MASRPLNNITSLPSLMQITILATNLVSSECLFNGVGGRLRRYTMRSIHRPLLQVELSLTKEAEWNGGESEERTRRGAGGE